MYSKRSVGPKERPRTFTRTMHKGILYRAAGTIGNNQFYEWLIQTRNFFLISSKHTTDYRHELNGYITITQ